MAFQGGRSTIDEGVIRLGVCGLLRVLVSLDIILLLLFHVHDLTFFHDASQET